MPVVSEPRDLPKVESPALLASAVPEVDTLVREAIADFVSIKDGATSMELSGRDSWVRTLAVREDVEAVGEQLGEELRAPAAAMPSSA
jgi:hypothetical protein